jgi:hypothetical protein
MKMKSCTAAILLLISLQAVADGRLSAAATDDGVNTIRLPSHGNYAVEARATLHKLMKYLQLTDIYTLQVSLMK